MCSASGSRLLLIYIGSVPVARWSTAPDSYIYTHAPAAFFVGLSLPVSDTSDEPREAPLHSPGVVHKGGR